MHAGRRDESELREPSPAMLVRAYANGIFPMADPDTGELHWFRPTRRGVIPLDAFHVPKNVQRAVRQRPFEIRCDTAFSEVMRRCAAPREGEDDTWIDERLVRCYTRLFEQGHAHSIEAWREGRLVGGLYGVHLGGAFFGESMFHRPDLGGTNASKICLVHLVAWLRAREFALLDTQYWNEHLGQFGCVEIPHRAYMVQLRAALAREVTWGMFEPLA